MNETINMCIFYSQSLVSSINMMQKYKELGWQVKVNLVQQMIDIDIVNVLNSCS